MRICFITPEYALYPPFGGIATHIRTMARWLARNGHDVHVVCPSYGRPPEIYDDDGVAVRSVSPARIRPRRLLRYASRLPGPNSLYEAYCGWGLLEDSLGTWRTVWSLERRARFDVIQCGDYGGLAFWGLWPAKHKTPLLLRGHGLICMSPPLWHSPGGSFQYLLEKTCAHKADFILASSHYLAELYGNEFGVAVDRLGLLYRPYDSVDRSPSKSPVKHEGTQVVLYVGRIEDAFKGVGVLLDALQYVHAHLPGVRASFIGKVVPSMAQRFDAFLEETKGWVTYWGSLSPSDVLDRMCQSDILVLPSRNETAGGVLVEAQFCGLPQVATRVGGIPELVQDGITGSLVNPGDPVALARAIMQLCTSSELRRQMGQRSIEQAHLRFDLDTTMTRYVRVLEALMEGRNARSVL